MKYEKEYFPVKDNKLCIVVDQFGIYLIIENNYVNCNGNNPFWKRTDINFDVINNMRKALRKYIV